MRLRGLETLSSAEVEAVLAAGGRFVFFEYCISLVFWTLRRPSDILLLQPGELGLARGLPYTLCSLLLGWWGIPWGLVYTARAIFANLSGGHDVTSEVRAFLRTCGEDVGESEQEKQGNLSPRTETVQDLRR